MIHDDWLFRFGFPGFAETVWVLPRGVRHEEPWYEPLPWGFACHALDEWALADSLADRLRELHRALLGAPLFEPDGVPLHALLSPLRDAFAQGDLVAWALCTHSVRRPAQKPATKPGRGSEPTARPMAFELAVVDELGTPVPGAALELQTRGGVATITTNGAGVARLEGTTETEGTVRITNEDDVRHVLARRWSTVRGKEWAVPESLSPETEVEVLHADAFPRVRAHAFPLNATVERHTIILEPRVLLASLHGAWFDRHRAFVLPTALDGVRFAVRRAEENPGTDVLIVGHTDPVADAEDPPTLSLDRARSVVAFMTGTRRLGWRSTQTVDRLRRGGAGARTS